MSHPKKPENEPSDAECDAYARQCLDIADKVHALIVAEVDAVSEANAVYRLKLVEAVIANELATYLEAFDAPEVEAALAVFLGLTRQLLTAPHVKALH